MRIMPPIGRASPIKSTDAATIQMTITAPPRGSVPAKWREAHPGAHTELKKAFAKTAKGKAAQKRYEAAHVEYITERRKNYNQRPYVKRLKLAHTVKRYADERQQTPPWADLAAIKAFYMACPAGHHVDHIIPLRGKLVSGLHVLENLQYLLAKVNMSKGNRYVS